MSYTLRLLAATLIALLTIPVILTLISARPVPPLYNNAKAPIEQRVTDLLSRMTPDEKIAQLDMYWGKEVSTMSGHESSGFDLEKITKELGAVGAGSIHDFYPLSASTANDIQRYAIEKTRLGIPVLFIEEGLHGYSGKGSTSFPIPLQLSAAWDTTLIHAVGRAIATETRAHGVDMLLAPVLCLPRDPRWGRVEETYGEDTWLDARNGVAMVKGLQGNGVDRPDAVISEPKHFAVHGIPEAGSNTAPVNMGEREARSSFLYVFEKAVREGGALSMMAAYSELDGIPCVDNRWLLTDVLRKEWGFKGFVLSDLGAIRMSLENHRVVATPAEAMARTLKAGLNMQFYDWPHAEFRKAMHAAIDQHLLTPAQLDAAVRDILRVKFMAGLFDHPYTDTTLVNKVFHTAEHQQLALKAATEGITLLKNDNQLLPIKTTVRNIALIGPLATSTYLGGYSNGEAQAISVLDGLRQRAGNRLNIRYEPGYDPDVKTTGPINIVAANDPAAKQAANPQGANAQAANPQGANAQAANAQAANTQAANAPSDSATLIKKALDAANNADLTIVALGEEPAIVGEGKDRAHLQLSDQQTNLIKALTKTGKPIVVLLSNGRPLCIDWVANNVPAIVETWFSGEQGGLAIADILLGNVNPSGRLPMTFPRSEGQIPFYYNHKPTSGHRYVDEKDTPLWPFGHGLSYTQFGYTGLQVNGTDISVTVKNTGPVAGDEITQLYLKHLVSSVTTPGIALKGFARTHLEPNESKTLHFHLGPDQLSIWNEQMKKVVEPGKCEILIGASSTDIRLTTSFVVK
jgi:beta-glucosidase